MSSKHPTKKGSKKVSDTSGRYIRQHRSRIYRTQNIDFALTGGDDTTFEIDSTEATHPHPVRLNPESEEEREKRLAKRKALTLRIFQSAYENHHKRKAS